MLGSLEKRILSVLFREKRATARNIHTSIEKEGFHTTYVSVNTVLSRLHKKGLVGRTKENYRGRFRYQYEYVEVKEKLISSLLRDVDTIFGEEGIDHLKRNLDALDSTPPQGDTSFPDYGAPRLTPERIARMYMSLTRTPMNLNETRKPVGRVHVVIERCKGCGYCWVYCPEEVLEESSEINSRGYHYPSVQAGKEEGCVDCGMCTEICPDLAIFSEEIVEDNLQTTTGGGTNLEGASGDAKQEVET